MERKYEESSNIISLESIEFVFRHPLLVISTIIVMFNLISSYVSGKPLSYRCTAVLSFELGGDDSVERRIGDSKKELIDARRDLISKALLGDNIRRIAKVAQSDINEELSPAKFDRLLEKLRSPKDGIQLKQDDKNNINLVTISFISAKPEVCYRVVKTTVETIRDENKKARAAKTQAKIDFLNKQVEFYKDKIEKISREMDDIRNVLIENFPLLTEKEKDLISGVTGDSEAVKQQKLVAFAKYDDVLTQLNLELIEAERRKENLKKQLTGDAASLRYRTGESPKEDIFLGEYSKAIAAKELEIAALVSSGYKIEHPQIKKIQNEMDRLRELGKNRTKELSGSSELSGAETAKGKISAEIEDLDFQIESLRTKMVMINEHRRGTAAQFKPNEIGRKDIGKKAARFIDLDKERSINEGYYLDIRKQLEEADLRGRIEKEEAGLRIVTVEEPEVPINPIPLQRIKSLLMGFILSVFAGLSLAYIVDSLNSSVKTSEELRKMMMVPVLAAIDRITTIEELEARRAQRKLVIFSLIGFMIVSRILIGLILKLR